MLESLKEAVWRANLLLPAHHLVTFTWGNVSGIHREAGLVVIKPSGVPYDALKPEDMAVVDLQGRQVEGRLNPSSDTPTHLMLYKGFPDVGGIVHTHSRWATIWAQAARAIPPYGTTHADDFHGPIPCTRALTAQEVESAYERETGQVILDTFAHCALHPLHVPGCLVSHHGPFTWGKTPDEAVHHAVVLEEVAMMAWHTEGLHPAHPAPTVPPYVLDKHFQRKHGPHAYYGQKDR